MQDVADSKISSSEMPDRLFPKFRSFIQEELGIKMPDVKKTMLQARLQKRLRKLGLDSFEKYYDYVFSPDGIRTELQNMIDVVTTNKTDFFREPRHFNILVEKTLPELIRIGKLRPGAGARFWSAGCSTGKEPYTLAMVLSEFAERHQGYSFSILATDISTKVLNEAALGIYNDEAVEPIPMALKKKYLLRSKDRNKGLVWVAPEIRSMVRFRQLNFMDDDFGMEKEKMHIIFCRNVIIYFERRTQEIVLNRLCRHLIKGGYIFMGHSETLNGLNLPLTQVSTTVYRKI